MEKSFVKALYYSVIRKEVQKLVKRTTSPIDDYFAEVIDNVFQAYLSEDSIQNAVTEEKKGKR